MQSPCEVLNSDHCATLLALIHLMCVMILPAPHLQCIYWRKELCRDRSQTQLALSCFYCANYHNPSKYTKKMFPKIIFVQGHMLYILGDLCNYCPQFNQGSQVISVPFYVNTVRFSAASRDMTITRCNQIHSIECNFQIFLKIKCSKVCCIFMNQA